ncbi:MAG: hypothetical protein MJ252_06175 [archaeon]|nr:hypothetical protein [archaeon]
MEDTCSRAMQCSRTIIEKLHNLDTGAGNKLSVKIGLGAGECSILFVGGTFNRAEYVSTGSAMKDACSSECHCTGGGQIVISEAFKSNLKTDGNYNFVFDKCPPDPDHADANYTNFYKFIQTEGQIQNLKAQADAFLLRTKMKHDQIATKIDILKSFVPAAVVSYLEIEMENWCRELRNGTVMFCSLPISLKDLEDNPKNAKGTEKGMNKVQQIIKLVQRCVYCTRGSVNKFLMDEKGSSIITCWGLPPFSSYDDPTRAVSSALLILDELKKLNCINPAVDFPKIGISTGCCFSGTCGSSGDRREYTILGEIVNLAARMMQSSLEIQKHEKEIRKECFRGQKDKGNSIFLCEKTRAAIMNKIETKFRLSAGLKGFSVKFEHFSPENIENFKYLIDQNKVRIHPNSFNASGDIKEMYQNFQLLGFKTLKDHLNEKYKKVLKGGAESVLISGMLGSGKSSLINNFITEHKKDEKGLKLVEGENLFISNITPISHINSMDAFHLIFKHMFAEVKKKDNSNKTITLKGGQEVSCDMFFKYLDDNSSLQYLHYVEDILGILKQKDNPNIAKINYKYLKGEKPVKGELIQFDPFFAEVNYEVPYYKEPDKRKDNAMIQNTKTDIKKKVCDFFFFLISKYQKLILKGRPLVIVVEDCQKIDLISNTFICNFRERMANSDTKLQGVFLICSYQVGVTELKDIERELHNVRNKRLVESFENCENNSEDEELITDKKFEVRDIMEVPPMVNTEDITQLINTNIKKMSISEDDITRIKENKKVEAEKYKDTPEYEEFLKPEPSELVKDITIDSIEPDLLKCLIELSFKGNPLFLIENFQSLLNQGLIIVKSQNAGFSSEFRNMYKKHDYSQMVIPNIIEKLCGNIIDSFKSTEIIILKHAAVIGNIFDIQTLNSIVKIPSMTFDDLVEILKYFDKMRIIDILYDKKPKRIVAMFCIPLLREVLYQRMLKEQKNDVHAKIAQNMQFTKFSYLSAEEEKELLEHHLQVSEETIVSLLSDEGKKNIAEMENENSEEQNKEKSQPNLKILTTREIVEKLKIIELRITSSYNTIKDISKPHFLSIKYDHTGPPKENFFGYILLSNKKLFFYKDEGDYLVKTGEPLEEFELKNIYQIEKSTVSSTGERQYKLEIKVSSYEKINKDTNEKEKITNDKKYDIIFTKNDELNKWEIALNLLRIKNMYDEFTSSFGMLQLPLNNDLGILNKQFKRKMKLKDDSKKGKNKEGNQVTKVKKEGSSDTDINSKMNEMINNEFGQFLNDVQSGLSPILEEVEIKKKK